MTTMTSDDQATAENLFHAVSDTVPELPPATASASYPPARFATFCAPELLEQRRGDRRSRAALAVDDDLAIGRHFGDAFREMAERNVNGGWQMALLPFVRIANVDHGDVCGRPQLIGRHLIDGPERRSVRGRIRDGRVAEVAGHAVQPDQRQRSPQPPSTAQPAHRPRSRRSLTVYGTSQPAQVTNDPLSGMLSVPGTWPLANSAAGRVSITSAPLLAAHPASCRRLSFAAAPRVSPSSGRAAACSSASSSRSTSAAPAVR